VLRLLFGAGLRQIYKEARFIAQQRLKRCAGVPAWASPHFASLRYAKRRLAAIR